MLSAESRFLAVQEWIKGNILPDAFIGESLLYTLIYYGQFGITKNFENKFQYLDSWQNLK
jgi:hypothetical protein